MMDDDLQLDQRQKETGRLSPIDRTPELHPWRRAQNLTRCFLYWMPISHFPMGTEERMWLIEFLDRFVKAARSQFELRSEVFLGSKAVEELRVPFVKTAVQFSPILGWSRRPGAKLRPMPSDEEIQDLVENKKSFDATGLTPDRCYWFLKKAEKEPWETFLGHGGMTILLLKSDPGTKPPPLPFPNAVRNKPEYAGPLAQLEALMVSTFAMKDGFLAKSKQLFGKGLEEELGYPGVPLILPQLRAEDFFDRPAEESEKWFQLWDVYLSESPADKGMLLASKIDVEETLIGLLGKMRDEGLVYPERS
jgi:hypothetical protein